MTQDAADGITFTNNNLKNFMSFARYGKDSGTNVVDATQGKRYEAGVQFYRPDGANVTAVVRKVGLYFNPMDGLVQHPDIAGYNVNFFKPFKYSTTSRFTEFDVNGNFDRYHNNAGALDQTDQNIGFSLATRTLFNFQLSTGSSYLLLPSTLPPPAPPATFTPITQQGVQIAYNLNSSMPTFVNFNTGRFGPGRLDSWARSSTVRVGTRGTVTLEADDTDQYADSGARFTEWLERASFAYQSGPDQSLALGVRRIIGTPPELVSPSSYESGWNLSAAFHQKVPGGEIYVVYGDASAFSTAPRFIVKYIRYFGADKGT
jgi:hypothetical protein